MPVVAGMCRRAFARDGRGQRGWRGSEPPPAREESSLLAPEEPSAFRPRKAHRAVPSCGLAGAHARERAASRWDRKLRPWRPPLRSPHQKNRSICGAIVAAVSAGSASATEGIARPSAVSPDDGRFWPMADSTYTVQGESAYWGAPAACEVGCRGDRCSRL